MKKLQYGIVTLGCDPEFFFSKKGKIIGSEKILPKEGLTIGYGTSKIIIDGVQAELNPEANTCRERLAFNIKKCFETISLTLKNNKGIKTDFSQTIEISKKELNSLAKESRTFGCAPSKNIHNPKSKIAIKDASTYKYRSAGGHIHLGTYNGYGSGDIQIKTNKAIKNDKHLVPMLDIIVGNTCVLIDRDPGNIERRKVYGRAGEYRLPSHGLEYRTLSNFWLQNYQLFSLATGLARFAVLIIANSSKSNNIEKKIKSRIRMKDIENAINNNDYNLAYKNFKRIRSIIKTIVPKEQLDGHFPLNKENMTEFEYFITKGKDHFFKEDPIKHWTKHENTERIGWERFLMKQVKTEREKELTLIT